MQTSHQSPVSVKSVSKRLTHGLMMATAAAVLLSACASKVKLDDADASGKGGVLTVPSTSNNGAGVGSGESSVSSVSADSATNTAGMGNANLPSTIYFDYDSYLVRPDAIPTVEGYAKRVQASPSQHLTLEGHTDERGGREYNLALGQKRAEAVLRALTLLGVADDKLEAVSMGEEQPALGGSDESAWSQNRRVEFKAH